jgi:nucleotide-binding universal stress UspA family protein
MLREEGEQALDDVDAWADDVDVERVLLEGAPSTAIVDYATDEACDLIVMGTHGRGGIDRLLLGSVAERVVRTSSVPVLTVRVEEPPSE